MKLLIGLSGGLDSASAARILKEQGHEVVGAYIKMFPEADVSAAEITAKEFDIPLRIIDGTADFEKHVLSNFVDCYRRGLTPNPCVECNRHVKIKLLCALAKEEHFDGVVTGHYGNVVLSPEGRYAIRSSKNGKDQSYMLWMLDQEQLKLLMLPLFEEDKAKLRQKAEELGLHSASAKESMDICFLPDGNYAAFIEARCGKMPEGDFVNESGKIVGRHKGILHYTVGQRKHLGVALGEPVFVSEIDPRKNRITLVPTGKEYSTEGYITDLNFQGIAPRAAGAVEEGLNIKLRYKQEPVPVKVIFEEDGAKLLFDSPVRAITPGQSAVLYKDDMIAFGGKLRNSRNFS